MNPLASLPTAAHLWQSTLFAAVAGLLTLALRRNQARVRYWLWVAASYKFLFSFSWLVSVGHLFRWHSAPTIMPLAISAVTDIFSGPLFLSSLPAVKPAPDHFSMPLAVIWTLWACGFTVVVMGWLREWLRIRTIVQAASPFPLGLPIPVISTASRIGPGVFGIFRPVLLLPEAIKTRLTPAQLQAVVAHELCHVRRRDNLTAAVHMLVEAIFWFYPLVWWLGARMIDERETACGEAVLQTGSQGLVYAESILKVCEFYSESPIACISGVTGSDLKKRMHRIMKEHFGVALSVRQKLLLTITGVTIFAVPIIAGMLTSSAGAQAPVPTSVGQLKFDTVSVKPSTCPRKAVQFLSGGRIVAPSVPAKILIGIAYGLPFSAFGNALVGAPDWVNSQCFGMEAHAEGNPPQEQIALMMRSFLADRFKLAVHWETRQLPVFALVEAKPSKIGPQLVPHAADNSTCRDRDPKVQQTAASVATPPCGGGFAISRGHIVAESTVADLAQAISWFDQIDRAVVDRTGLSGVFDITVNYEPSVSGAQAGADANVDSSLPSTIFTALQEQLGLKLESQTGPVNVLIVDHIEQPSPN